ncbi:MAG: autotransporter outer membrane beta-barrel domain-containing protein [Candidatus Rokuibacteriota bacterium]
MSILFPRLLDNTGGCSNIQGPTSGRLGDFCNGIPNGTSSGVGAPVTSVETRTGEEAVRGRLERLKKAGRGASADGDELGRGLGMFVTTEYQSLNKGTSMFELGFEQNTTGATVGVDYSFGRLGVLGAAFNYQHEFGDFAGQTGGYDNDLYSFIIYGTVTPLPSLFVDLNAGYTRKEFGIDRRVSLAAVPAEVPVFLGRINGDTHSNDFRLGARIGYDFFLGPMTIGPRIGASYRESAIAGFRETGNTGIELIYGDQTVVSLTTTTGLYTSYAISTNFGVIVPHLTGEYIHEFANDRRSVPFRFVNAPAGTYRFLTESPDRDYFTIGAGAVLQLPSGLTPFVNYVEVLDQTRRAQRSVTLGLRFGF